MPKFAANLSMTFTEHDFLDRFGAAAAVGFKGVEYLFPYAFAAGDIAGRLGEHGLAQVLFNLPPGDWDAGERGITALPGRESEFEDGLGKAIDYAKTLGCPRLHAMAGVMPDGTAPEACHETYVANLKKAAGALEAEGLDLMIEPINTHDIPGFFLATSQQAVEVIEEIGAPNLFLQYDVYHMQIMEGDLAETIKALSHLIRHFQIAGVPGRFEPDVGEINYPYLFALIDELGYGGWIGCEYKPKAGTREGLGWARDWGIGGG